LKRGDGDGDGSLRHSAAISPQFSILVWALTHESDAKVGGCFFASVAAVLAILLSCRFAQSCTMYSGQEAHLDILLSSSAFEYEVRFCGERWLSAQDVGIGWVKANRC
jgi:hypothetical protein